LEKVGNWFQVLVTSALKNFPIAPARSCQRGDRLAQYRAAA